MKRWLLYLGFLVFVAIETFVQVGFKFAGENVAPLTFDVAWLGRVVQEPLVYVVLAGAFTAFLIYMALIKYAPIGPAFAVTQLEIVTVAVVSVYFLGERINLVQLIGCCAIVAGVLILALTEKEH